MNDRIERFATLKSFLGGLLSQANSIPSDFVDISARTDADCCTVTISLRWDAVGKLSIRSQEALAELEALTDRGEVAGGGGDKVRLHIQTKGLGKTTWCTVGSFADEDEVAASACYWHAYRELNNSDVRLIVEIDGQVKVLQSKGDTR